MNYKKVILIIGFLLICNYAHAGYYVFHTGEVITGKRGPCGRACRTRPDALSVDEITYQNTTLKFHKVVGGIVVEKTQIEKDIILQDEADAAEAQQCTSLNNLEITIKASLAAWLQVYNFKVPVQYQVSNAELKAQVISNEGVTCP